MQLHAVLKFRHACFVELTSCKKGRHGQSPCSANCPANTVMHLSVRVCFQHSARTLGWFRTSARPYNGKYVVCCCALVSAAV
jgi:hypothetical protein